MITNMVLTQKRSYFFLRLCCHHLSFQILFPQVCFVASTNNAPEVIFLEYAKTEDVPVQKDSHLLTWLVKKGMICKFKKQGCVRSCLTLQMYYKRKSSSLSIFVEIYKKDNFVDFQKLQFPYTQYMTYHSHLFSIFK